LTDQLDPRGVRFAAAVTTVVLAVVLLTGSGVLAAVQAVVFAIPVAAGMRWSPYGALYRALVAPRLGPPTEREDAAPVRFSQAVGLVFTLVAAVGYLSGATVLGLVATAMALAAAFLNAAFGFCLGCEMYGLLARVRTAR
jgi:sterol desaturase/sphingolipid hydroxylase (fatty acid hydroxylase superfamily)